MLSKSTVVIRRGSFTFFMLKLSVGRKALPTNRCDLWADLLRYPFMICAAAFLAVLGYLNFWLAVRATLYLLSLVALTVAVACAVGFSASSGSSSLACVHRPAVELVARLQRILDNVCAPVGYL